MDNRGASLLQVPGFGDHPLTEDLPIADRFAHGFREWKQVPAITQREFVMVAVMNELTDKPNWHVDVFCPGVVDHWRDQILAITPLMSEKAWEWCIAELRDKAAYFQAKGHFRVLDTGSCVCKSDTLGGPELCADLQSGLQSVLAQRRETGSDGVTTYVDPALYPMVWGKSRILAHGGYVTRQGDIVGSPDSGTTVLETAPRHRDKRTGSDTVQERMAIAMPKPWRYVFPHEDAGNVDAYLWSYKFQWIPSEVEFNINSTGTDVRLTSYINGLDLDFARASLYGSLETLISLSIEPWNDCLIKGQVGWDEPMTKLPKGWAPPGNVRKQRGRVSCRIVTYGVEWENEAPEWVPLFDGVRRLRVQRYLNKAAEVAAIEQEKPPKDADRRTKIKHKLRLKEAQWDLSKMSDTKGIEQLPEPTPEQWVHAREYLERPEPGSDNPTVLPEGWEENVARLLAAKIRRLLHHKHPEPGSAFSYDEWKSGTHGGRAIVDMVTDRPIDPTSKPPSTPHTPYPICLQDQFRSQGLQVITCIQGISLSPENPEYPGGTWDLAGQKNEHIVALAMFAYDVENVTPSHISFRQETEIGEGFFHSGSHLYSDTIGFPEYREPAHRLYKAGCDVEAISDVFGFDPHQMCGDLRDFALPVQEIGRVALPQGRLVAFPNTMESRREAFRLQDPTRPGHHRWVTLMLVDPNYRLCSTRNIPPQWEGRQRDGEQKAGNEGFIGREEAEGYKKEMEKEHIWMQYARYDLMGTFFFC